MIRSTDDCMVKSDHVKKQYIEYISFDRHSFQSSWAPNNSPTSYKKLKSGHFSCWEPDYEEGSTGLQNTSRGEIKTLI